MSRERTIIDDLYLIQRELDEIHLSILNDSHVKQANYTPGYSQVRMYFDLFQNGVEYAQQMYGEGILASALRIYSQFTDETNNSIKTDVICYDPNIDEIEMTLLHIATECVHYNSSARIKDDHLAANVRMSAESHTLLQAIEECYHRYQIRHLGYVPVPTNTEAMKIYEQEITTVWQKAIADLKIPLFP